MLMRLDLKSWIESLTLTIFGIYLISGNLLRFANFGFTDNSLVTELFLYCLSLVAIFWHQPRSLLLYLTASLILLSTFVGTALHGPSFKALLYTLRLLLSLFSAVTIGKILYKKFENAAERFSNFMTNLYLGNVFLGFILFFLFPKSQNLWFFLQQFGIKFGGDPHISRFVSTYFDPNYFSSICSLPFILAFLTPGTSLRIGKLWLFFLAIMLSGSRSGIATFFMVLLFLIAPFLFRKKLITLSKRFFLFFFLACFGGTLLLYEYGEAFTYLIERSWSLFSDPSAMARFSSWDLGWKTITTSPVTGVGYNYLNDALSQEALYGLDSSLQTTVATLGIPLSLLLIALFMYWSTTLWKQSAALEKEKTLACTLSSHVLVYLWICLIFSSQFNNLLYFQFWLVPVATTFSYLSSSLSEERAFSPPQQERLS